jgi:hypothetical protein
MRARNHLCASSPEEDTVYPPSRLPTVVDVRREVLNSTSVDSHLPFEHSGYTATRNSDEEGRGCVKVDSGSIRRGCRVVGASSDHQSGGKSGETCA